MYASGPRCFTGCLPAVDPIRFFIGHDGRLFDAGSKDASSFDYNVETTLLTTRMAHAAACQSKVSLVAGSLETGKAGEEDGVGAQGTLSHDQMLTDPMRPLTLSRSRT